jgi:hypothetical protein
MDMTLKGCDRIDAHRAKLELEVGLDAVHDFFLFLGKVFLVGGCAHFH